MMKLGNKWEMQLVKHKLKNMTSFIGPISRLWNPVYLFLHSSILSPKCIKLMVSYFFTINFFFAYCHMYPTYSNT